MRSRSHLQLSIRIGLMMGILLVLLSLGLGSAIAQDSSQGQPDWADKGVWVLINKNSELSKGCQSNPNYKCIYPSEEGNSITGKQTFDHDCGFSDLGKITWTVPSSVLNPGTKQKITMTSSIEADFNPAGYMCPNPINVFTGAMLQIYTDDQNFIPISPDDGPPKSSISLAPYGPKSTESRNCVWDVPWGRMGDVLTVKIGYSGGGGSLDVYYTYTYQGQPKKNPPTMPPNHPPIIDSLKFSPSMPTDKDEIRVNVVAHDDDNDKLTYEWYLDDAKLGYTDPHYINLGRNFLTLYKLEQGVYHVKVRVSDNKGGMAESPSTDITVKHLPPTIVLYCAPEHPMNENVECKVNAKDSDEYSLTYKWYLDEKLKDESSSHFKLNKEELNALTIGKHEIKVEGSDNKGYKGSDAKSFNVRALPPKCPLGEPILDDEKYYGMPKERKSFDVTSTPMFPEDILTRVDSKTKELIEKYGLPVLKDLHIASKSLCRGACGYDCPEKAASGYGCQDINLEIWVANKSETDDSKWYKCTYPNAISCGTHLWCRTHDSCCDSCVKDENEKNFYGMCHVGCGLACAADVQKQGLGPGFNTFYCGVWASGRVAEDPSLLKIEAPYDTFILFSDQPVLQPQGPFTDRQVDDMLKSRT